MELIPGLVNDVSLIIFNTIDGNTHHALSVVSKTWNAKIQQSIHQYISFPECHKKARSGHYLHVLKHITSPGKTEQYCVDTDTCTNTLTLALIKNAIVSGNIRLVKRLLLYLDIKIYHIYWLVAIQTAYIQQQDEILKLLSDSLKNYYDVDTLREMIVCGVCIKGDLASFKAMMFMNLTLRLSNIEYCIGVGGHIEIFDEFKNHKVVNLDKILGEIALSGKYELFKHVLQYSPNFIVPDGYRIGGGGSIEILKLFPQCNLMAALKGACRYNKPDMIKYILSISQQPLYIITEVINKASYYEYEESLTILLDHINHDSRYTTIISNLIERELKANRQASIRIITRYTFFPIKHTPVSLIYGYSTISDIRRCPSYTPTFIYSIAFRRVTKDQSDE